MKRYLCVVLTIILIISLPIYVFAEEINGKPRLSDATDTEILSFLTEYEIEIPGGESNYSYWRDFILSTIMMVEQNPSYEFVYNWTVSLEFANEIKVAINDYYGNSFEYGVSLADSYTLVNSVKAVDWDDSYANYNCYAYAIGKYYALDPGDIIGSSSNTLDAFMLSNLVIRDLEALNYKCVQVSSYMPSSVPNGSKVICLRSGAYDYHFMKLSGSWYHKPGLTLPLRWRHSSPAAAIWSNECITYDSDNSVYLNHAPDVYYNSTIYYFVYKQDHSCTTEYGGEDYHSGNQHYYKILNTCEHCGDTYYSWDVRDCSGPPCLGYMSLPIEEPELETE